MFNFGAAVDVATDDCLSMAGPSRTSEATPRFFIPSVRSPTRRTKKHPEGQFAPKRFREREDHPSFFRPQPIRGPNVAGGHDRTMFDEAVLDFEILDGPLDRADARAH